MSLPQTSDGDPDTAPAMDPQAKSAPGEKGVTLPQITQAPDGVVRKSIKGQSRRISLSSVSTSASALECSSPLSAFSGGSPSGYFADPDETLIYMDWDDTLFPTTEMFDRWGLTTKTHDPLPQERADALRAWENALYQYLSVAATLSEQCCILTNSKRPWISACVDRFAPRLRPLLGEEGAIKVVYAREHFQEWTRRKGRRVRPVVNPDTYWPNAEYGESYVEAKYVAMKRTAEKFYKRYPGRSWKNIISIGDMWYERDAALELAFRCKDNANLRVKTITLPTGPTLSELTLRLQFDRLLLPAYVHHNGDIDVGLGQPGCSPLVALGQALKIPELGRLSVPLHAWGQAPPPEDEAEVTEGLIEIAAALQGCATPCLLQYFGKGGHRGGADKHRDRALAQGIRPPEGTEMAVRRCRSAVPIRIKLTEPAHGLRPLQPAAGSPTRGCSTASLIPIRPDEPAHSFKAPQHTGGAMKRSSSLCSISARPSSPAGGGGHSP